MDAHLKDMIKSFDGLMDKAERLPKNPEDYDATIWQALGRVNALGLDAVATEKRGIWPSRPKISHLPEGEEPEPPPDWEEDWEDDWEEKAPDSS